MSDTLPAVHFNAVDVIFGPTPKRALALLDQGRSRAEILAAFGRRVGNPRDTEFATALAEVETIALLRLKDLLP